MFCPNRFKGGVPHVTGFVTRHVLCELTRSVWHHQMLGRVSLMVDP